jgi:hypothetical protein
MYLACRKKKLTKYFTWAIQSFILTFLEDRVKVATAEVREISYFALNEFTPNSAQSYSCSASTTRINSVNHDCTLVLFLPQYASCLLSNIQSLND